MRITIEGEEAVKPQDNVFNLQELIEQVVEDIRDKLNEEDVYPQISTGELFDMLNNIKDSLNGLIVTVGILQEQQERIAVRLQSRPDEI